MLYEAKSFKNYALCGIDGTIGKVKELLFDDQKWNVRYLVVDTGNWLRGRKVLIAPNFLVDVSKENQCITVNLTKKQIEDSPPLSSDKPVDRQFDKEYWRFFSLPESVLTKLPEGQATMTNLDRENLAERRAEERSWDRDLRSTEIIIGDSIVAPDGVAGCVDDFIIDDQSWAIRYIVVDSADWWPGHKLLVAPPWISKLSWGDGKIFISTNREPFKELEEFTSTEMLTREYETRLYQSCNRKGYWVDDPACKV